MTERRFKILVAVIEQYAETPVPVGSVTLAKLFNVSSATIRSEMAKLEEDGYLEQPHTSAGRIPTDKGYRLYVNKLNESSFKSPINRSARVIDVRVRNAGEPRQTIRSAVKSLVELTDNVGLATLGNSLYVYGLANLFDRPELTQMESAREVAALIDNLEPWLLETSPNQPLSVYIGQENPVGKGSDCSLVISRFRSPYSNNSYIGVLGPTRQDYKSVMNLVGYTGKLLESVLV